MRAIFPLFFALLLMGCESNVEHMEKIIFLHHSTGHSIWLGKTGPRIYKYLTKKGDVQAYFKKYNRKHKTNYHIQEFWFPQGYKNMPYDYYNIWVKNAGDEPALNNPTLEILTKEYSTIVYKHCYPVSKILEDTGNPDINSDEKRLENYKLQYNVLKQKLHEFPDNKFILWTPAVHVENRITPEEAQRTKDFYKWIISEWDEKGDNIFLWDFYKYETESGMYLPEKYATGENDSHPNKKFAKRISPILAQFILDVVQGKIKN